MKRRRNRYSHKHESRQGCLVTLLTLSCKASIIIAALFLQVLYDFILLFSAISLQIAILLIKYARAKLPVILSNMKIVWQDYQFRRAYRNIAKSYAYKKPKP